MNTAPATKSGLAERSIDMTDLAPTRSRSSRRLCRCGTVCQPTFRETPTERQPRFMKRAAVPRVPCDRGQLGGLKVDPRTRLTGARTHVLCVGPGHTSPETSCIKPYPVPRQTRRPED